MAFRLCSRPGPDLRRSQAAWAPSAAFGLAVSLAVAVSAAAPSRSGIPDDPALRKPVTLHLGKTPLSEIAAELERETGLRMTASADTAGEPAVVWVTDLPAREVMRHLAELFNYRWRRSGPADAPRYELYQDLKSKQAEEALRRADRLRGLQGLLAAVRLRAELARRPPEALLAVADLYDDLRAGARQLSPEAPEAASRRPEFALMGRSRSSSPLREMAGSHWRALARLAASLTPEQWDALVRGESLLFSTQEEPGTLPLPPAWGRELRTARPTNLPPGARTNISNPELFQELEQRTQSQWVRALGYRVRVRLDAPPPTTAGPLKLLVRPSTIMPADFGSEQQMNAVSLEVSSEQTPDPVEGPVEPKDPALRLKRRWEPPVLKALPLTVRTVEWRNEALPRIAGTYGVNLIADAYRDARFSPPAFDRPVERPLYEVLNGYLYPAVEWRKEGEVVRVRRRRWYFDRLAEIPRPTADRWEARLRKTPGFSLVDLAELALSFRDEQFRTFRDVLWDRGVEIDSEFEFGVFDNREILRAYASLSPLQRQLLHTGGQIPSALLPPEAQRSIQAALVRRNRDSEHPPPPAGAPAALSLPPLVRTVTPVEDGFLVQYSRKAGEPPVGGRRVRVLPREGNGTSRDLEYAFFVYQFPGGGAQYFSVRGPTVTIRPSPSPPASPKAEGDRPR